MMMNRLEDLWMSADDGASSPVGHRDLCTSPGEADDLLDAWYVERRNAIECEILLDLSKTVLKKLLAESDASSAATRQARKLLRAIDRTLRLVESGEA
jgi:hypothetical protein